MNTKRQIKQCISHLETKFILGDRMVSTLFEQLNHLVNNMILADDIKTPEPFNQELYDQIGAIALDNVMKFRYLPGSGGVIMGGSNTLHEDITSAFNVADKFMEEREFRRCLRDTRK